jgi:hypothetical protein
VFGNCFFFYLSETKETKKGKFLWIKGSRDIAEKLRKPLTPKDESKVYSSLQIKIKSYLTSRSFISKIYSKYTVLITLTQLLS